MAKKTATKRSGGVMAKLRAAKAEVKKKQGARAGKASGGKGAETPADDAVTAARKRKIREEAERSKGQREERHFADTPQQRISANAGARGRKAQAKRDGK
jgi:hypothetical protein